MDTTTWLRHRLLSLAVMAARLLIAAICVSQGTAAAQSSADIEAVAPADDPARTERWSALKHALFGERQVLEGTAVIQLDAPSRAPDASLVELTLNIVGGTEVKSVYLVIDDNPSPLAGHITFGAKADPSSLKLRVRVNAYSLVHAVAEDQDGALYGVSKFVKAAGGCSAPADADETAALRDLGLMKMELVSPYSAGRRMQARLMIHHPNCNGMQMNQITRRVTPAQFIKTTEVTYNGAKVFRLESDISMSTDPVVTFGFVPEGKGTLAVHVVDSENRIFVQSFDVPASDGSLSTSASGEGASGAAAAAEPQDFWTGPVSSPTPATLRGGTVIRAPDLATLLKLGAIVVDVSNSPTRPANLAPEAVWMPAAHMVVPGSLWLPGVGAGALDEATDRLYQKRLTEATAQDLNAMVVFYCHERCWLSWNAAKRAVRYGYKRVYWFAEGIEGWKMAGFPTAIAQPER